MTLDDLITWAGSQATRLDDDATELNMAMDVHFDPTLVSSLKGKAEIMREITTHLKLHRDHIRNAQFEATRRQRLFVADV